MAYLIEFANRAARDLETLYVEKNAAESQTAARWYEGLEEAVSALARYPRRWPRAGSSKDKTETAAFALRQKAPRLSGYIRNR